MTYRFGFPLLQYKYKQSFWEDGEGMKKLFYIVVVMLFSAEAAAFDLELDNSGEMPRLLISNTQVLHGTDVYLAWYDMHAAKDKRFISLRAEQGWSGGLHPVFGQMFDIPLLNRLSVPYQRQDCPLQHACFVALVAVEAGNSPLDPESWLDASILPLNRLAAQQRLPGQNTFLATDGSTEVNGVTDATFGGSGTTTPSTDDDANKDGADTEKPDIFRLDGKQVLYANSRAQRFQVIDTGDLENPTLTAWIKLGGSPREVYKLGDFYGLLQSSVDNTAVLRILRLEQNSLHEVSSFSFDGLFLQSRRRGDVIYALTQDYNLGLVKVYALQVDVEGQVAQRGLEEVGLYNPVVAIFSDYLLIAGYAADSWNNSRVQVFDIRNNAVPLQALPAFEVNGQIPSEFHLNINGPHLRLVYGPQDRSAGSTLAVYDLSAGAAQQIGSLSGIAPGESLYATRFEGSYAYVVTFLRTDPLWVIDIANPTVPFIAGQLEVPGWSEKMFFNAGHLFAVGYDDQVSAGEIFRRARRVSLSLFDVRNPLQPSVLDRFTPLTGVSSYSYSPAVDDERALLLDWVNRYAALPVNAWDSGSHLQITTFADDKLHDAGLVQLPDAAKRAVELDTQVLGVLGDQSFMTVAWGSGKPFVLGELELARNLAWVQADSKGVWAAARNNSYEITRFYRYVPDDLETEAQSWNLTGAYNDMRMAGELAVFFDYNSPFAVQLLDTRSGTLHPPFTLVSDDPGNYLYSNNTLLHDGILYQFNRRYIYTAKEGISPGSDAFSGAALNLLPDAGDSSVWILNRWQLSANGAKYLGSQTIPGEPLGFSANGDLLSREADENRLRLNLVRPGTRQAQLLHSIKLDCPPYSSIKDGGDGFYVLCVEPYYTIQPLDSTANTTTVESGNLIKVKLDRRLQQAGSWKLPATDNYVSTLHAAAAGIVLVGSYAYYYDGPYVGISSGVTVDSIAPYGNSSCSVYRLEDGTDKAIFLQKTTNCSGTPQLALTSQGIYRAKGFAGLEYSPITMDSGQ